MNKRILLGVIAAIAIIAIYCGTVYNHLVTLNQQVQASWAQVQNVYQRRLDLIPTLVATVKGYATHEQQTFVEVTQARSQAQSAVTATSGATLPSSQNLAQIDTTQSALTSALGRLMVVVERYPDLKASQNFMALQYELAGTENRIAVERRRFNETTMAYNTAVRRFPTVIFARLLGFAPTAYFQAEPSAQTAPQVNF